MTDSIVGNPGPETARFTRPPLRQRVRAAANALRGRAEIVPIRVALHLDGRELARHVERTTRAQRAARGRGCTRRKRFWRWLTFRGAA